MDVQPGELRLETDKREWRKTMGTLEQETEIGIGQHTLPLAAHLVSPPPPHKKLCLGTIDDKTSTNANSELGDTEFPDVKLQQDSRKKKHIPLEVHGQSKSGFTMSKMMRI